MSKTPSKSKSTSPTHKTTSPTRKTNSKSKVLSTSTPKIIITLSIPSSKRAEGEVEGEETVTYLFLTEAEEHKIERKLSERFSPKRSKKSGTFLTQDEGKSCI